MRRIGRRKRKARALESYRARKLKTQPNYNGKYVGWSTRSAYHWKMNDTDNCIWHSFKYGD